MSRRDEEDRSGLATDMMVNAAGKEAEVAEAGSGDLRAEVT